MDVPGWLWIATVGGLLAVITLDLILVDSRPGVFGPKQATRWVVVYVSLAVAFGVFIWVFAGAQYAGEFFAGYITEYSLSVDNLFVFIVIISSFAVPREYQHRVLLVGVVIALMLRALLITVGAAAIERFSATFYIFGLLLVVTAINLFRRPEDGEEANPGNNFLVRNVARVVPTTTRYDGSRLTTVELGRRKATPMLLVMLAIGTTDILFALDSIPAIFGLTQEPYLVFAANAFALMGLRQLYFLVAGLLEKLVFLSYGLAVILLFIGVKLILHAIHETTTLPVPEIGIGLSLAVIFTLLLVTTVISLLYVRRHPALVTSPSGLSSREAEGHRRAAAGSEPLGSQDRVDGRSEAPDAAEPNENPAASRDDH